MRQDNFRDKSEWHGDYILCLSGVGVGVSRADLPPLLILFIFRTVLCFSQQTTTKTWREFCTNITVQTFHSNNTLSTKFHNSSNIFSCKKHHHIWKYFISIFFTCESIFRNCPLGQWVNPELKLVGLFQHGKPANQR